MASPKLTQPLSRREFERQRAESLNMAMSAALSAIAFIALVGLAVASLVLTFSSVFE